jgi:hypothetical protein
VNGPVIVCSNGTTNIVFTNPQAIPVTITYNINGGASSTIDVAASSTATIPATTNVAGTFNYNLVSVEYQGSPSCQISRFPVVPATVTVEPVTTVAISRSPAGTICYGETVNFVSTVTNAGTNPSYQWYLNGVAISGETGTSLTSTTLNNTDRVSLVVTTSDTPCPGNITSNEITMTVNPTVTPTVNIYESANPVCDGSSVTFTAFDIINGGTTPAYQWRVNGTNVGVTVLPIVNP